MDNNLQEYAEIAFKGTGNTVTMTVRIPAVNPRKNVPPLVFNRNDALVFAQNKYGKREVSVVSGPTLENRPRTNLLEGEYVLQLAPQPTSTRRTRSTKTKTTTTRKTKTK